MAYSPSLSGESKLLAAPKVSWPSALVFISAFKVLLAVTSTSLYTAFGNRYFF
ncbi:photosystem II reaction center protein PsbN [Lactobacillus paracasei subsp. paracasei]|nr:photosystem II reaction center protein PsbN [Lacticaseibacillus paracasei]MBG1272667.1 photosystem II reaction center protein PsbN [Lacticaseibacillus paracasei subsp. paracasei]RDV42087.1 hypothetical protein DQM07_05080 [Lacticaseibacillus paracasei subsp. paracasei]TJY20385.1 photosystem II reaction center protein PsbN [Lacticaseibacillus paracasei]